MARYIGEDVQAALQAQQTFFDSADKPNNEREALYQAYLQVWKKVAVRVKKDAKQKRSDYRGRRIYYMVKMDTWGLPLELYETMPKG